MSKENKKANTGNESSPISETHESIQTEMDEIFELVDTYANEIPVFDVVVGTFIGFNEEGYYLVDHPLNRSGDLVIARSTVALDTESIGREVALMFEGGDLKKPIVRGFMYRPEILEVKVISAKEELVLRCGKASIVMKKDGTISITGTSIVSKASGNNDMKGGSINLN